MLCLSWKKKIILPWEFSRLEALNYRIRRDVTLKGVKEKQIYMAYMSANLNITDNSPGKKGITE